MYGHPMSGGRGWARAHRRKADRARRHATLWLAGLACVASLGVLTVALW